MSKTTEPQPSTSTGRLDLFEFERQSLLANPKHFKPTMKIEPGEERLGSLNDSPVMKGYYLLRSHRHEVLTGLIEELRELDKAHSEDHRQHGKHSREKCDEFMKAAKELVPQIQRANDEYQSADQILRALFNVGFNLPRGLSVVGYRENFEIIARKDNDRGDLNDPLDGLQGLSHVTVIGLGDGPSLADLLSLDKFFGAYGFGPENPYSRPGSQGIPTDILDLILSLGGIFGRPAKFRKSGSGKPTTGD